MKPNKEICPCLERLRYHVGLVMVKALISLPLMTIRKWNIFD